jgi:hypothetical protein
MLVSVVQERQSGEGSEPTMQPAAAPVPAKGGKRTTSEPVQTEGPAAWLLCIHGTLAGLRLSALPHQQTAHGSMHWSEPSMITAAVNRAIGAYWGASDVGVISPGVSNGALGVLGGFYGALPDHHSAGARWVCLEHAELENHVRPTAGMFFRAVAAGQAAAHVVQSHFAPELHFGEKVSLSPFELAQLRRVSKARAIDLDDET